MEQVAAEEEIARKADEEAQRETERALRARGVEGCWLYKQSPKSYSTFFKRWFVYSHDSQEGGQLQYYKDCALTVRHGLCASIISTSILAIILILRQVFAKIATFSRQAR